MRLRPESGQVRIGRSARWISPTVLRCGERTGSVGRAALGRLGEERAAARLPGAGLHRPGAELALRAYGEVDLICARGRTLVVCEVKARSRHGARPPARSRDAGQAASPAATGRRVRDHSDDLLGRDPVRRRHAAGPRPRRRRRCVLKPCRLWSTNMETLIVERKEGVVTVTMNRPERKNAANGVMLNELKDVFAEVEDSPDDRVIVLTGAGGAFCSGRTSRTPTARPPTRRGPAWPVCAVWVTWRWHCTTSPSRRSPRWTALPSGRACLWRSVATSSCAATGPGFP